MQRQIAWKMYAVMIGCLCPVDSKAKETPNLHVRGGFQNSRIQFEQHKAGRVAFMGGSITEMNGYRPMVAKWLQKRHPDTKFDFINAGISSTCSTTGAFRLERDVLSKGQVDLFFLEFAVNDDQDAGHSATACIRGMEGLLRRALAHNPNMDIVVIYFVNPGMLKLLQENKTPIPMQSHEKVAKHYQVTTVHLAQEIADRITAGTFTWKQYGGTHPAPAGNAVCANLISELLQEQWSTPLDPQTAPKPHVLPRRKIDEYSYSNGHLISPDQAKMSNGFQWHVPDWKQLPGSSRSRFTQRKMLCATEPGAELTVEFKGTAIGAYIVAGPDAGMVEVSVDGSPFQRFDLYHRHSRGLHYPRTVMFANELQNESHTLNLRVIKEKNPASKGHAIRVMSWTVN